MASAGGMSAWRVSAEIPKNENVQRASGGAPVMQRARGSVRGWHDGCCVTDYTDSPYPHSGGKSAWYREAAGGAYNPGF